MEERYPRGQPMGAIHSIVFESSERTENNPTKPPNQLEI